MYDEQIVNHRKFFKKYIKLVKKYNCIVTIDEQGEARVADGLKLKRRNKHIKMCTNNIQKDTRDYLEGFYVYK